MKKVTDLGENEVIHCPTEREAIAICQLMHDAGFKWNVNDTYIEDTAYKIFKHESCYSPKMGYIDNVRYCQEDGRIIYPASDFLPEDFYEVDEAHSSVVIDPVKHDEQPVMMVSDPTIPSPELLDAYNLLSNEAKKEMREKYPLIKWPVEKVYVSHKDYRISDNNIFGHQTNNNNDFIFIYPINYCTPEIDHEKGEIRFVKI